MTNKNAIVSTNGGNLPEAEVVKVLQNSLYPGAEENSVRMVIGYCKAMGLDVMQKPVHIVPMWDSKAKAMRDVIMPGINMYRVNAQRTGELAGISEPEFGEDKTEVFDGMQVTYPEWCKVTVKRRLPTGEIVEFVAKEYWKENYATKGKDSIAPNSMWQKRTRAQLVKCTESQGLRKAFPELAGQNTAEEMDGKIIEADYAEYTAPVEPVVTKPEPQEQPHAAGKPISDNQRKRFYALYKNAGKADEYVRSYLKELGFVGDDGEGSTSAITTDRYEEVCRWAESIDV